MAGTIVITAGGTAGHLFPAEALAATLRDKGCPIVLMTDARTGRRTTGPFADVPQYVFPVSGLVGRSVWKKLLGAWQLGRATLRARAQLRTIRPVVIVGFGGYSCVPAILAGRLGGGSRPRLVLHEGNAVLGRANRFLAQLVDEIATSFDTVDGIPPGTATTVTGFPVREEIRARAASPYPSTADRIRLLVWGGSLGARIFADVMPQALCALPDALRSRREVTQQARSDDLERVASAYRTAGIRAEVKSFYSDVGERLAGSHLVIGRAGGSSVAELAAVGRPSILVPLPIAASNEQGANAARMVRAGGAWMIEQADFTAPAVAELVRRALEDPAELARMGSRAHGLAHLDAEAAIAKMIAA